MRSAQPVKLFSFERIRKLLSMYNLLFNMIDPFGKFSVTYVSIRFLIYFEFSALCIGWSLQVFFHGLNLLSFFVSFTLYATSRPDLVTHPPSDMEGQQT